MTNLAPYLEFCFVSIMRKIIERSVMEKLSCYFGICKELQLILPLKQMTFNASAAGDVLKYDKQSLLFLWCFLLCIKTALQCLRDIRALFSEEI